MTIDATTEEFAEKPVRQYDPETGLVDAPTVAYRLAVDWERHENGETAVKLLEALTADPNAPQLTALLIGDWGGTAEGNDSGPVVEALVKAAGRLPRLTALFLGDMTYEECEISWIEHGDVAALYAAFPQLEELRVRGAGLSLGRLVHGSLRRLIVETGGLDKQVLAQVASAELPQLEHLELWLGDDGYGWNGNIDDVRALLDGARFPKLTHLGLRNSQIADEIAEAVASSTLLPQLEVLDLSLGVMTDAGAQALATSPAIRSLRRLDVHHNYLTSAGVAKLSRLGVQVDASDQQEGDDHAGRYVAVSE